MLLLTAVALFLFTRDRLPLETSSLAILIILVAGFEIFPYDSDGEPLGPVQFFAGFGNEALVTICALMIVGKALYDKSFQLKEALKVVQEHAG